jgi:type II secretory pathway pseudopilin PulG
MKTKRTAAFSLIELLVVFSVIAILILILLPAVNAVREMGRRTQCINNQRNLIIAVINYESAQGAFPSALPVCNSTPFNSLGRERGVDCAGPNWAMQILSQMEEDTMYDQVAACLVTEWHACDDCQSQPGNIGRFTPAYLICPSAPISVKLHHSRRTGLQHLSKGNYAACLGSEHYRTALEQKLPKLHELDDPNQIGVMSIVTIHDYQRLVDLTRSGAIGGEWKMAHGQGTRGKKIKDGASKTIVLSEVLAWDGEGEEARGSEDIRGVWTSASMGASTYSHKFGPNSTMPDRVNACDQTIPRDHALFCEQAVASGPDSAETWASARSAHRDGVVAALADGSVRFFNDDIHLPLWHALATRAGQELQ